MGKIVLVKNLTQCLNCVSKGNWKTCFSIWCDNQVGYESDGQSEDVIKGYKQYSRATPVV